MSESPYEGTFRERIAVNRRNSLFLIACFLAFITVFGYIIGYAWIGDPVGALFGLGRVSEPGVPDYVTEDGYYGEEGGDQEQAVALVDGDAVAEGSLVGDARGAHLSRR